MSKNGGVWPGLFADYPKIGWNADAHVFSLNMFDFFGFAEVNVLSIDKSTHTVGSQGDATFQLHVFQDGDVNIRLAYHDVSFGDKSVDAGASATIGIQMDASNASQFSFNEAVPTSKSVMRDVS